MATAYLQQIAHKGSNFVKAYPALGKLAAEDVAVVEAGPADGGVLVRLAEVGGEVVGVPPLDLRAGEEPAGIGGGRGVPDAEPWVMPLRPAGPYNWRGQRDTSKTEGVGFKTTTSGL